MKRVAPWIFVVIWSSGFIVAKYAFANSDVIAFLSLRLFIAAALMAVVTLIARQSLKLTRQQLLRSLVIGVALHAIYLGGVWEAVAQGSPSGIASVVTSLQPVLVSLIAVRLLGERLSRLQISGLVIGFVGVGLVVAPSFAKRDELTLLALLLLVLALAGSTSATLLQKKSAGSIPLLAGTTYQFLIAAIVLGLYSLATNQMSITWNLEASLAMAWAVIVTSMIAILLLLWMLTHGSAAKVSSLLYLVPPATALQAFILFGEKLNAQGIVGIAATALGVALVQKS